MIVVLHNYEDEALTNVCRGSPVSESKTDIICTLVVAFSLGSMQSDITVQSRKNVMMVVQRVSNSLERIPALTRLDAIDKSNKSEIT